MIKPRLIIFAKAPLMGKAKTRLAANIGPAHAQRLYRAMTRKIIRNTQSPKWETHLAVTPKHWLGQLPEWKAAAQYAQTNGSLSPRLVQAFSAKMPTVVIGTDCPQVTSRDINDAFKALRRHDAVFGPADDGGFWLMGLRRPACDEIFENVRWSSKHALADVAANVGGSAHYLRTLIDVDDVSALKQVRAIDSRRAII